MNIELQVPSNENPGSGITENNGQLAFDVSHLTFDDQGVSFFKSKEKRVPTFN